MIIDPAPPDPAERVWQQLFPAALTHDHSLIAHKLRQAIADDIVLGHEFDQLLAADRQWLTQRLDAMAPPAQPDAMQPPPSLAQLDSAARALRGQLKQQKNLSKNYFVDCVLAELQHGVTLNATLFALFKKLTLLAAITLTRLNLSEQIREDGSIDAALRNVRLAADQRRGSLLVFLSRLDLTLPLDALITVIEDQRPEFASNKTLTGQVDTLLRVLERLVEQRVKQQRGGGAHREHANQKLEFSPLTLAEDQVQITRISALLTHQGRRGLSDGELEIQRDRPTDQETWLITQQGDDPEAVPPLMDWQARAQQSQSVALSMSLRAQLLPCDPGCAQARDITTLVKALCKGAAHQPAMLALLAMLVLGLDWPALGQLPVWTRGPAKWPGPGRAFGKDEEHFNDNGIWCLETHFALQRWHQVANSQVHRGLNTLLPKVHFYLLLPLPVQLRPLIVDDRWQPVGVFQDSCRAKLF
ncbi:hypothetical protein [Aeromonas caviae]|uniref:hypothetical protein n=1 Tax=Aeromonas caviae TaxID=648 RepID=UPI00301485FB